MQRGERNPAFSPGVGGVRRSGSRGVGRRERKKKDIWREKERETAEEEEESVRARGD